MRTIKLQDGTEITERKVGCCYEYYIGNVFTFGVEQPFSDAELNYLSENGYFEIFKL